MNQSKFLAITCNLLKAREIARKRYDWIWFCFSLVEQLTRDFQPVTKRSNRNHVITVERHLKTALGVVTIYQTNGKVDHRKILNSTKAQETEKAETKTTHFFS